MIYEKKLTAWKAKQVKAYIDCDYEDLEQRHKSPGKFWTLDSANTDYIKHVRLTIKQIQHQRTHENYYVLDKHFVAELSNGSREANLWSFPKTDGKLWKGETGSTPWIIID